MGRSASLDSALKRFSGALDQLEAAAARLGDARAEVHDLEAKLARMQDDRGRLADELGVAHTRTQLLERGAEDVSARLGIAGTALRGLLSAAEEG